MGVAFAHTMNNIPVVSAEDKLLHESFAAKNPNYRIKFMFCKHLQPKKLWSACASSTRGKDWKRLFPLSLGIPDSVRPDFRAFAEAGKELADLHLDYEKLEPYPLQFLTNDKPLSYVVEKMKLSKDTASLKVNDSLTLAGIPPEVYGYRLGNRSAVHWIIDQYQVSEDPRSGIVGDPNREDDPEYIVRLIGQVVKVSLETVRIVKALPAEYATVQSGS